MIIIHYIKQVNKSGFQRYQNLVKFLAARNPACNKTIRELLRKWAERTKKLTKWPGRGNI